MRRVRAVAMLLWICSNPVALPPFSGRTRGPAASMSVALRFPSSGASPAHSPNSDSGVSVGHRSGIRLWPAPDGCWGVGAVPVGVFGGLPVPVISPSAASVARLVILSCLDTYTVQLIL